MIRTASFLLLLLAASLKAAYLPSPKGFSFTAVSNRFITPNGDGRNDVVVFTFANPRFAEVTGRIYDIQGKLVTGSLSAGPQADSLAWDGKSGGAPVPNGLYVYVIEAEGLAIRGLVTVVR